MNQKKFKILSYDSLHIIIQTSYLPQTLVPISEKFHTVNDLKKCQYVILKEKTSNENILKNVNKSVSFVVNGFQF